MNITLLSDEINVIDSRANMAESLLYIDKLDMLQKEKKDKEVSLTRNYINILDRITEDPRCQSF
jgi:hypothetical protein